jgi:beta-glucosidase
MLFDAVISFCPTAWAQQNRPAPSQDTVDAVVSKMMQAEKLKILGGSGMFTFGFPDVGLPALKMSDGPVGVRTWGPSGAYPDGVALAATWDPALARTVGESLALDARERGVNVLLGPGVNVYRMPMNGRNFEYFGEDPT